MLNAPSERDSGEDETNRGEFISASVGNEIVTMIGTHPDFHTSFNMSDEDDVTHMDPEFYLIDARPSFDVPARPSFDVPAENIFSACNEVSRMRECMPVEVLKETREDHCVICWEPMREGEKVPPVCPKTGTFDKF